MTTYNEIRQQRWNELLAECQDQVFSQLAGAFGIQPSAFKDRNGGNVTTVHNFSRADDTYVATDDDRVRHAHAHGGYERAGYEVNQAAWDDKTDRKLKQGIDEYTGQAIGINDKVITKSGIEASMELDHVVSVKSIHDNKKAQLALGGVKDGKADTSKMRDLVNDDRNIAMTNKSANASKKARALDEWSSAERPDGQTNAEFHGLDETRVAQVHKQATQHVESTINSELMKKQGKELLDSGARQGGLMAAKQALGVLLSELVSAVFHEVKELVQSGVELGKAVLQELAKRIQRVVKRVASKVKDALLNGLTGGLSGFASNLVTFLINNFVSTAAHVVSMIRRNIKELWQAFKMMFFPPEGMSGEDGLRAGLKILSGVVLACVGVAFESTINGFLSTFPLLKPIAEPITTVIVGLTVGLTSAFVAYQIDLWFARGNKAATLREVDAMLASSTSFDEMATAMEASCTAGIDVARGMAQSIERYQRVGDNLGATARMSTATLAATTNLVEWQSQHAGEREELRRLMREQLSAIEQRIAERRG